jgi:hypothetical protein
MATSPAMVLASDFFFAVVLPGQSCFHGYLQSIIQQFFRNPNIQVSFIFQLSSGVILGN